MDFSLRLVLSVFFVACINVIAAIGMDLLLRCKRETILAYLLVANAASVAWNSALFAAAGLSVSVVVK